MARTVDSVVKEVLANQMVEIIQLTVRNEELQEEVKAPALGVEGEPPPLRR